MRRPERAAQRACLCRDRFASPIAREQLSRPIGKQAAHFTAHALHAWDVHVVVLGRGVPQPRDGRGFGSALDRDALGARDGAATDRHCMRCDRSCKMCRKRRVRLRETQKAFDGAGEVFCVLGLLGCAPAPAAVELARVRRIFALACECAADRFDHVVWCPYAVRESFSAALFGDGPRRAGFFYAARESSVTWWQEAPAGRHVEDGPLSVRTVRARGPGATMRA